MSMLEMDPVFTSALREALVATVEVAPRVRRRWRWRVGAGVFVVSSLVAGGAALAGGLFSPPGAPIDTPLGSVVTVSRTGSATIDIGPPPAGATDLSLTLTCLTVGKFDFPDGSGVSCVAADLRHTPPIARGATEVIPISPDEHTVTIDTSANARWMLRATYVNRVTTSWGRNASGQSYGVQNRNGTPDLVAVEVDHGKVQGYVKATELNCAGGGYVDSIEQALDWDKASQDRDISIPVYKSDGTTGSGRFVVGDASGPGVKTVPLSSLSLPCSTIGNGPGMAAHQL
jgi:hypothetical protein